MPPLGPTEVAQLTEFWKGPPDQSDSMFSCVTSCAASPASMAEDRRISRRVALRVGHAHRPDNHYRQAATAQTSRLHCRAPCTTAHCRTLESLAGQPRPQRASSLGRGLRLCAEGTCQARRGERVSVHEHRARVFMPPPLPAPCTTSGREGWDGSRIRGRAVAT